MAETIDVAQNLADVRTRIRKACAQTGTGNPDCTIIAVSKLHGMARIRAALEAGHRDFGENRVQEAESKWPDLKTEFPDVCLHLVGPLQSNKVRRAVALFDVIHSVDRAKIARAIARAGDETGRRPRLFIQVNTGEEPQKAGVAPDDLDGLVALCRDDLDLPLVGLMCIPPADDDPALHFALLAKLARRTGLERLSMGMSADFEIAASMGADYVRIGTAIFGSRPAPTR